MKKGGGNAKQGGFTIIETLIVLAVSGALLLGAMLIISGRQAKTEFQTAIQQMQQQFQQIVNETESGYYPNSGNFTCTKARPAAITAGAAQQGTNGDCVFLGKNIRFGAGGAVNTYTVYPIAGNRTNLAGLLATNLGEAWPTAVAPGTGSNLNAPDYSTTTTLPGGLQYEWSAVNGGTNVPNNGPFDIAILSSLSSYDVSSGTSLLNSGSQDFALYGYGNSWAGVATSKDVVDRINTATTAPATSAMFTLTDARICLASAGTNQSGLFTINGSGTLGVSLQIKQGTVC